MPPARPLWLLALIHLSWHSCSERAVEGSLLQVAVVDWSSIDGTETIWDGAFTQGVDAGFFLAAKHFNERRVDILPDLAQVLDCQVNISMLVFCDTGGNNRRASTDVLWFLKTWPSINAIAGFGGIDDAIVGSLIARAWNQIPVVSHWVSAEEISDKNRYPWVARTIPGDYANADLVAALVMQFEFQEVAFVYLVDGVDFAAYLQATLSNNSYTARSFEFTYATYEPIDEAVQQASLLGLNIIICATWALQLTWIADAAAKYGLLDDEHFWIFTYLDRNPTEEEFAASENLRRLMNGSVRVGIVMDTPNWLNFLSKYSTFNEYRTYINSYLPPRGLGNDPQYCANSEFPYQLAEDFFTDPATPLLGNEVWGYSYESVMSLGFAACLVGANGTIPDGPTLYRDGLMNVNFGGLSGQIRFDSSTGDRDTASANFKLTNWILDNSTGAMTQQTCGKWNGTAFEVYPIITFRTGEGMSHKPLWVTPTPYNENFLPLWAKILGYIEFAICNLAASMCVFWLIYNRWSKVVINSQGPLMGIICLGCTLASFAILMFTVDDNPADPLHFNVDRACMAGPTLLSLGLTLSLAALTAKTYRVFTIFNSKNLKVVKFGLQKVLLLVFVGVAVVLVLLLAWNLEAPLKWTRVVQFWDAQGNPTYSTGYCAGETSSATAFALLLILAYLASLVLTAVLAFKVRDVPSDYQESRYIALILLFLVQIYAAAIPSIVAIYSVVIGRFLLMSTVVFLTVVVILGLMFVPKIFKLGTLKEELSPKPAIRYPTTMEDFGNSPLVRVQPNAIDGSENPRSSTTFAKSSPGRRKRPRTNTAQEVSGVAHKEYIHIEEEKPPNCEDPVNIYSIQKQELSLA